MSRTRRLSLRARILVMLIGVTTVLLLVMGTVSTYLLARRVDAQTTATSAHLTEAAAVLASNPQSAAGPNYPGLAVIEVPLRGARFGVRQINSGTHSKRLADVITAQLPGSDLTEARNLAAAGHLEQAGQLLRAGGCQQFPYLAAVACQPIELQNMLMVARVVTAKQAGAPTARPVAVLFVGEPATNGPGAVRGFIIAELTTGAALIALLALAGEWLIGRGLTPLDEMTRTANEITQRGDLTARMPDADDQTEVGRLGTSINTMLDRIQQAFGSRLRSEQKVREFAADASHELRTPLTTIRGYAELYRQGALGPDQLPNAMRRIEQEAERMSSLVAELLELARLDRTSSLDLTETDLAGVVRDAVADAIAVEPRRPVHAEAPPRLVAVVDEPRIRQVLANLLGNVRAHTPVTTPVAVRLGAITGGVLIEVADGGAGMSTQDAIRAFDRFHRATDRPGAFGTAAADVDASDENQDQAGNEDDRASAPQADAAPRWLGGGARGAAARPGAVNGASANGSGFNGSGFNGSGFNGANGAVHGAGENGAGVNGASLNGAGVNGASLNGASVNGASSERQQRERRQRYGGQRRQPQRRLGQPKPVPCVGQLRARRTDQRQRPWLVDRPSDRQRARRPRDAGITPRSGHQGAGLAASQDRPVAPSASPNGAATASSGPATALSVPAAALSAPADSPASFSPTGSDGKCSTM